MDPNAFVTFDQLKTFMGQLAAVLIVGQALRAAMPTITTYALRLTVIGSATFLNIIIGLLDAALVGGLGWVDLGMIFLMAPLNGLIVALAAMKAAEFVKGSASTPS